MLLLHNYNIKNKVDKNITKVIKTKCMPTNMKTFICVIQSYYCVPFKTRKLVFYCTCTVLYFIYMRSLSSIQQNGKISWNDDILLSSLFNAFHFRAKGTRQWSWYMDFPRPASTMLAQSDTWLNTTGRLQSRKGSFNPLITLKGRKWPRFPPGPVCFFKYNLCLNNSLKEWH